MWIKLSKLFYVLLIMYYGLFQNVFFQIPNMMLILGTGMIGFVLLHTLQTRTSLLKPLTIELLFWTLFVITSLIFGLVIAVNQRFLISAISTFCQYLILIYGIIYIAIQDRKVDFFVKTFIIFAMVSAILTVLWGVDYGSDRISLGPGNNPNELGITMVIGICCIFYLLDLKKLIHFIAGLSAILLLFYITILTGSRKSFLSIILIMVYWLAFVVFRDVKVLQLKEKIAGIFSLTGLAMVGYYLLSPIFAYSPLFMRLTSLFETGSEMREGMYLLALEIFKQNPLVGIGFNNYRAVTMYATYSHSTYAEALACTGIIGSGLYFSPYVMIFINYLRAATSRKINALQMKQVRIMLGLFGILIFLGIGVIHFYSISSSIAFGILVAFRKVHIKNGRLMC